jgi:hypothetical protein
MHFEKVDEAIAAGDAAVLADRVGETCVRGCYRCLLSYFNQPDHELIDRASVEVKQMLIDLARGQITIAEAPIRVAGAARWEAVFKAAVPCPDSASLNFGDQDMSFVWRQHFVAASTSPLSAAAREIATAKGWALFELPQNVSDGLPSEMISMFRGTT